MALCTILLFGAFATAQYGRPLRGGSSVAPQVLSNLLETREILVGMGDRDAAIHPYYVYAKQEVESAIRTLRQAMRDAGMNPNRLPPPRQTSERDPSLVRIKRLLDETHGMIISGREYNGDLRAKLASDVDGQITQAQDHIDKALSIKQGQSGPVGPAQWRGPQRGGGGSVAPLVLSNLLEARDILVGMGDRDATIHPYYVYAKQEVESAIKALRQAMRDAGMDPDRLPPPRQTSERDPSLVRIKKLLDEAHGLITSGQEFNGDLRAKMASGVDAQLTQAQDHIDKALSIKGGQIEQEHQRQYDERRGR